MDRKTPKEILQPGQEVDALTSPFRGSRMLGKAGANNQNSILTKLHTLRDISQRMIREQREFKRQERLRKAKTFMDLLIENKDLNPRQIKKKLTIKGDENATKVNKHMEKAIVSRDSKGQIKSLAFVIKPKGKRDKSIVQSESKSDLGTVEDNLQTERKATPVDPEEEQDQMTLDRLVVSAKKEPELLTHKRLSQMDSITDFRQLALINMRQHQSAQEEESVEEDTQVNLPRLAEEKPAESVSRRRCIYYIKSDNECSPDDPNHPLNEFFRGQTRLKSYDQKIQSDKRFQNLILKDNLLILLDKTSSLKNVFANKAKTEEVFELLGASQLCKYNVKLEKVLCHMHYICCILMLDYKDVTRNVKLSRNPLLVLEPVQLFPTEADIFVQLVQLYNQMHDFLKDRVECYFIIIKQANCQILQNDTVETLFSFLNKSRYLISELQELYRIYDKKQQEIRRNIVLYKNAENHYHRNLHQRENHSVSTGHRSAIMSLPYFKNVSLSEKVMQDSQAQQVLKKNQDASLNLKQQQKRLMANLILNKFKNKNQNKQTTRESKIVLVNNKVDNSNLVQSLRKEKEVFPIADNRKRIQMERLQKPHEMPIIKEAVKIIKKSFNQFKSLQPI